MVAGSPRLSVRSSFDRTEHLHIACARDVGFGFDLVELGAIDPDPRADSDRPLLELPPDAEWSAVRSALVTTWQTTRDPELAALVDAVDTLQPPEGFEGMLELPLPDLKEALEARLNAPDPRWTTLLVPWLSDAPFVDVLAWDLVLRLLDRNADARWAPAIQALATSDSDDFSVGARLTAWAQTRGPEWIARQANRALEPTEQAILPRLRARLEEARQAGDEADLTALYEAAIDGDDGALAVWADNLLQRGESARGEWFTLALQPETRERKARKRALLKAHWAEIVGPIGKAFGRSGARFDRGFLVRGELKARPARDASGIAGAPEWRAVREVVVPRSDAHRADARLVLQHATRLHTLVAKESEVLIELPPLPSVKRLELQHCRTQTLQQLELSAVARSLPALEEICAKVYEPAPPALRPALERIAAGLGASLVLL